MGQIIITIDLPEEWEDWDDKEIVESLKEHPAILFTGAEMIDIDRD